MRDAVDDYTLSRIISQYHGCEWYEQSRTVYVPQLCRSFLLTVAQWERYADERKVDQE